MILFLGCQIGSWELWGVEIKQILGKPTNEMANV